MEIEQLVKLVVFIAFAAVVIAVVLGIVK